MIQPIVIAIDSETWPIQHGLTTPPLVCVSYALRNERGELETGLLDKHDGLEFYRRTLEMAVCGDAILVFANAPFDLAVAANEDPSLVPFIFAAYEKGAIRDVKERQKLIDLADGRMKFLRDPETGEFQKQGYTLAAMARRLLHLQLDKGEDSWQLRYRELDGVPIKDYPEPARRYAMKDAEATLCIYEGQQALVGPSEVVTVWRDGIARVTNEVEQLRAGFALHLIEAWGIRTDPERVAALKAKTEKKIQELRDGRYERQADNRLIRVPMFDEHGTRMWSVAELEDEEGRPTKERIYKRHTYQRGQFAGQTKVSRSMKEIKRRVAAGFAKRGRDCPRTPTGDVATDGDTLLDAGDRVLTVLSEIGDYAYVLSNYIPWLERGTRWPINPNFNLLLETGRTSCSNPNCFDGDTEVLTERGWVKFWDYGYPERVAQWRNGVIEFVSPTSAYRGRSELIRYSNEHIDLCVTPNHRCLLRHRKTGELREFDGEHYPEDWQQIHAGVFDGDGSLALSPEMVVLLCATQADGSWHDSGIDFCFKKQRKIDRLRSTLEATGTPFSVRVSEDRTRFRVQKSDTVARLRDLLGAEKRFGPWLLKFSRDNLDLFCEEVFFWDGCWSRKSMYASAIEDNATWVQTALTLSGARVKLRTYIPENPNARPSYQTDVTYRDYSHTTNIVREDLDNQSVYCVSVPSSYLLVRRNGRTMVTGNCQNLPRVGDIRPCICTRPGWVLCSVDYEQLELCSLSQIMLWLFGFSTIADAINAGKSLHLLYASVDLGISYEEAEALYNLAKKSKTHHIVVDSRQNAKGPNFGLPGGMGPAGLVAYMQGQMSRKEWMRLWGHLDPDQQIERAKYLITIYHRTYPDMGRWFKWGAAMVGEAGQATVVQPVSGRRRGDAFYCQYLNSMFQGLAADGAKDALWKATRECIEGGLHDAAGNYTPPPLFVVTEENIQRLIAEGKLSGLYGCHVANFVHDELIVEMPEHRAHEGAMRLSKVMIDAMKLFIPDVAIRAKPALFRNWFKDATDVYDANGRLVPWEPAPEEKRRAA